MTDSDMANMEVDPESRVNGTPLTTDSEELVNLVMALRLEVQRLKAETDVPSKSPRKASRHHSEAENRLQDELRKHTKECLKLEGSPQQWNRANSARVENFNQNPVQGDGPSDNYLLMDWDNPGQTRWTKEVASVLARSFFAKIAAREVPIVLGTLTRQQCERALLTHIAYLKGKYAKSSIDEEEDKSANEARLKKARRYSRLKQLLDRRLALAEHHGYPDGAIKLIKDLGLQGMSSEESEGEVGGSRTYEIKRLPWRADVLSEWLHHIDRLSAVNLHQCVLYRRSYARNRRLSLMSSESRLPVVGLPHNLYDPTWLKHLGNSGRLRLRPQPQEFPLPNVATSSAR
ncbi:hypothetical protein FRC17_004412 [Serendipita sp. 399]|nr:hypothetical protein FRC17_004412 [Serendipita sp. 399]